MHLFTYQYDIYTVGCIEAFMPEIFIDKVYIYSLNLTKKGRHCFPANFMKVFTTALS